MKPVTKFVVGTGVACMLLGTETVASLYTSLAAGTGQGVGVTVEDGIPALVDGFQNYEGGQTPGMFGEAPPLGTAPGGPSNPS